MRRREPRRERRLFSPEAGLSGVDECTRAVEKNMKTQKVNYCTYMSMRRVWLRNVNLNRRVVKHRSIENQVAEMTSSVERKIVEAQTNDTAPLPVLVDLRVVHGAPTHEVAPAEQHANVPPHDTVHDLDVHLYSEQVFQLGRVRAQRQRAVTGDLLRVERNKHFLE